MTSLHPIGIILISFLKYLRGVLLNEQMCQKLISEFLAFLMDC